MDLAEFPTDLLEEVIDAFVQRQKIDVWQRGYVSKVGDVASGESQTVIFNYKLICFEVESKPWAPFGIVPQPFSEPQRIYTSGVQPVGCETVFHPPNENLL